MFIGLYMLSGSMLAEDHAAPLMIPATLAVILGVLLMLVMVLQAGARPAVRVDA